MEDFIVKRPVGFLGLTSRVLSGILKNPESHGKSYNQFRGGISDRIIWWILRKEIPRELSGLVTILGEIQSQGFFVGPKAFEDIHAELFEEYCEEKSLDLE